MSAPELKHNMKPYLDVQICSDCGAALHKNGVWFLAGYSSKTEPPCHTYIIDKEWMSAANPPIYPDCEVKNERA